MTEELKKQAIAEDAAVAETVEETGATPGLDEAAKAIGVAAADMPAGPSRGKETFFDGKVFDPADPAGYLASLQIKKVA